MRFVHDTLPQRVCFGSGSAAASLSREVGVLEADRVMLIVRASAAIARALGSADDNGAGALDGLTVLTEELDAPHALKDYGFAEDAIDEAAAAILPSVPGSNPRPVTAAGLRALLAAAWSGADPRTIS